MHKRTKYLMPEEFRTILESIILQYSSVPLTFVVVPDVAAWAKEANIAMKGNPMAAAIPATTQDPRRVVMRHMILKDEVEGVLSLFDFQGYFDEVKRMRDDPKRFAAHLLLHELAHLENNWGQNREMDCDAWAFQRLSKLSID